MPDPAQCEAALEKVPKAQRKDHKKGQCSHKETYSLYVHKKLKQVHPDYLVYHTFELISRQVSHLEHSKKHSTFTARDIQTAMCLLLTGELTKHALAESIKAFSCYTSSK
ncbi:histone H2B type 1-O-like [Echinops telfairi]|uniref:Histone H2B type 1-O-like n=1 Tax=Echinops telfairi TaxID=9371 RepID=A0ABM0ZU41_ECHTE|nr:histone H2B type 1-O-like [Echinops telfairi]